MLLKRSSPVFGENQPESLSNIIQLRSCYQRKALAFFFLCFWDSRQYFCVFYIMEVEHLFRALLWTALALALAEHAIFSINTQKSKSNKDKEYRVGILNL